jgi:hypothetical protein
MINVCDTDNEVLESTKRLVSGLTLRRGFRALDHDPLDPCLVDGEKYF